MLTVFCGFIVWAEPPLSPMHQAYDVLELESEEKTKKQHCNQKSKRLQLHSCGTPAKYHTLIKERGSTKLALQLIEGLQD